MQFIPARGRKPQPGGDPGGSDGIAIYPREGTETQRSVDKINARSLLQFIPARGRKPMLEHASILTVILQFIPARGRKHRLAVVPGRSTELQFIPARGRKLFVVFGLPLMLAIAIYPREGTET